MALPDGVVGFKTRNEAGGVKITVGFLPCGDDVSYMDDHGTPDDPSDDTTVTVHDPGLQYFARWAKKGGHSEIYAHDAGTLDGYMQQFFGSGLTDAEAAFLADAPTTYPCTE